MYGVYPKHISHESPHDSLHNPCRGSDPTSLCQVTFRLLLLQLRRCSRNYGLCNHCWCWWWRCRRFTSSLASRVLIKKIQKASRIIRMNLLDSLPSHHQPSSNIVEHNFHLFGSMSHVAIMLANELLRAMLLTLLGRIRPFLPKNLQLLQVSCCSWQCLWRKRWYVELPGECRCKQHQKPHQQLLPGFWCWDILDKCPDIRRINNIMKQQQLGQLKYSPRNQNACPSYLSLLFSISCFHMFAAPSVHGVKHRTGNNEHPKCSAACHSLLPSTRRYCVWENWHWCRHHLVCTAKCRWQNKPQKSAIKLSVGDQLDVQAVYQGRSAASVD